MGLNSPIASDLGATIRSARQAAGLSVRQLAEQSGVSRSAVSDLERGKAQTAQPNTLARLAQCLEIRTGDLFELAGIPLAFDNLSLPAMLRAEYDLPPELISQIQQDIETVARRYHQNKMEN